MWYDNRNMQDITPLDTTTQIFNKRPGSDDHVFEDLKHFPK